MLYLDYGFDLVSVREKNQVLQGIYQHTDGRHSHAAK